MIQQGKTLDNPHDKGYKHLLSSKKAFIEMLKSFIKEKWVEEINEANAILVNKSYILPDFSEKEADVVYRIKLQGKEVVFYVLLELQSSVDFEMPIRLLFYITEIWRDLLKNTDHNERARKEFRLPVIIPLVLYNGTGNWTACMTFKEVLDGYNLFGEHVIDFKYFLLDVNRYSQAELYSLSNLMGSVFLLDQRMDVDEFRMRLRKLIGTLSKLEPETLQLFKTWFKKIIKPKLPLNLQPEVEAIIDEANPWEVEKMVYNLEHTLEEMRHKAEVKGIEKGIERGIEQGIEQGKLEEKLEVARVALKEGADISFVAKITGLTIKVIEDLKKTIKQ